MPSYRPIFYLPVVAPPSVDLPEDSLGGTVPFTDPDTDYAALTNAQAVVAAVAANQGLKISISGNAKSAILSMTGGTVSYVPKGKRFTLPDGTELRINDQAVSTGAGTLVLEVWNVDVWELLADLPPDLQTMTYILYHNIKDAPLVALRSHVQEMSTRLLEVGTGLDVFTTSREQLEEAYLDRVIEGKNAVFVSGGTLLGEAEAPVSVPGSNAEVTLQFVDSDGCDFSPIRFIREMPNHGGLHWNGHPLIAAAADLQVTEDPSALDVYPVGRSSYSGTSISLYGSNYLVQGTVYYPADSEGEDTPFNSAASRAPIVFIAHGNHPTTYTVNKEESYFGFPIRFGSVLRSGWVELPGGAGWVPTGWVELPSHGGWVPAGWVEIPNHEGYDYFQDQLARMGIIAVSVYSNQFSEVSYSESNIEGRARLILASIEHFQSLDSGGDVIFGDRVDFSRVGLMGHSRGGEAVVVVPEIANLAGVGIKGVLSLAPTDAQASSGIPAGYSFMTVLPAGDGDVIASSGARFYDKAIPAPLFFKCQLYIHLTNHNYFNRQWVADDSRGPSPMDRLDHERILKVYGSAFFRAVLLGHDVLGYLFGQLRPPNLAHCKVHISFEVAGQSMIDDHEDGNGIGLNSLGQPTNVTGGMNVNEYTFAQGVGAYNGTFYGNSIGMIVESNPNIGIFRSQLAGATDLSTREIWLRAAEVYNGSSVPSGSTGFELGVEDTAAVVAWVDSDVAGGLPRPYDRRSDDIAAHITDQTKTMLETLRFKPSYFKQAEPQIDLTKVQAILIRFNRPDPRAFAFDDLQIVSI